MFRFDCHIQAFSSPFDRNV